MLTRYLSEPTPYCCYGYWLFFLRYFLRICLKKNGSEWNASVGPMLLWKYPRGCSVQMSLQGCVPNIKISLLIFKTDLVDLSLKYVGYSCSVKEWKPTQKEWKFTLSKSRLSDPSFRVKFTLKKEWKINLCIPLK